MKIGLFFGSFNPIHNGHMAIADYMSGSTDLDQVWLVVSPHNPLKKQNALADAKKRLARVKKVIGRNARIKVSDVEFRLPQPSYTIRTLDTLTRKYPKNKFSLIIGSDNLSRFHKWKDYRKILSRYKIYVYPRSGPAPGKLKSHRNVKMIDAPRLDISSTAIRARIQRGKDVKDLIPKIR